MTAEPAISIAGLSHRYGTHPALADLSLEVATGEIFGLLGPNGGGKSTLFHLLSTILPLQHGRVLVCGCDLATRGDEVRRRIGVTFQSPSLDGRLTVAENLRHQGHLYGLRGRVLDERQEELLSQLRLQERRHDRVESLSGGMQRRVELVKGLLHRPQLLLLDEPCTGLDPGSRHDLWKVLRGLREASGMTIVLTTHLMDDAEQCDRVAILDRGTRVACGTPEELKSRVGGDTLTISTLQPQKLCDWIEQQTGLVPLRGDDTVRLQTDSAAELPARLMTEARELVQTVTIGRPSLEDVFLEATGRRFTDE